MNRLFVALIAVIAAVTGLFVNRGFKVQEYKEKTGVAVAAGEGTSTCGGAFRGRA